MRRRRKGSGGTWFPVLPSFYGAAAVDGGRTFYEFTETFASAAEDGDFIENEAVAIPLTLDQTFDPGASALQTNTLSDYVQGQDWVCKRVVGKVWGATDQTDQGGAVRNVILCIGLAVLPWNEDPAVEGPSIPPREYNPLMAENAQQPWLWRRTWTLTNNLVTPLNQTGPTAIGNVAGGNADAGHLDTKGVARRIRREQRLAMCFTAAITNGFVDETPERTYGVTFGYDVRIFGAMRRSTNQSTFK